jgi:ABC-type dipeptide/oligopeptide/nickel transport system ATPase component
MRRFAATKFHGVSGPMTSLNPVLTIGWQIAEALVLHRQLIVRPR